MGNKLLLAVVIISLPLLGACDRDYPVDVFLASVTATKKSELASILGGQEIEIPFFAQSGDDFLKIDIGSKSNLADYAAENFATVYSNAYICDKPTLRAIMSFPDVYRGGANVSSALLGGVTPKGYEEGEVITYSVFIRVAWEKDREIPTAIKIDSSQRYYLKFNLFDKPEDVCLEIAGGNMVNGFKSNTVKITKEKIFDVLHRSP